MQVHLKHISPYTLRLSYSYACSSNSETTLKNVGQPEYSAPFPAWSVCMLYALHLS